MQTSNATRKSTDKTPTTPERREHPLDGREVQDVAAASDSSSLDMHGYDELPFTD